MTQPTAAGAQPGELKTRTFFEWLGIIGPIAGLALVVLFLAKTNWYQVFKTIHVLAAVLWLGGGALITLLAWKAQRAKDNVQMLQVAKQAEWASTRIFVPASLVVVTMGVVLMHKGNWGYSNFWPLFGLIAWSLSFLVGVSFLGPQSGKLAKLIELKGPEDPDVAARTSRIIAVARADVVLILVVAADMVAKPFLS